MPGLWAFYFGSMWWHVTDFSKKSSNGLRLVWTALKFPPEYCSGFAFQIRAPQSRREAAGEAGQVLLRAATYRAAKFEIAILQIRLNFMRGR